MEAFLQEIKPKVNLELENCLSSNTTRFKLRSILKDPQSIVNLEKLSTKVFRNVIVQLYILALAIEENDENQTLIEKGLAMINIYMEHNKFKHGLNAVKRILDISASCSVLENMISILYKGSNKISMLHCKLAGLYVQNKLYDHGEKYINELCVDMVSDLFQPTMLDLLSYYYYSGMIFTARKEFRKARDSFMMNLMLPSKAVSVFAIESYKKYILVSLLVHHDRSKQDAQLPKAASPILQRTLKVAGLPYIEFSRLWWTMDVAEVEEHVANYSSQWKYTLNEGLVKQCVKALRKQKIVELTQIYLTLSLNDVAKAAHVNNVEDAEKLLVEMIQDRQILAKVDKQKNIVLFSQEDQDDQSIVERFEQVSLQIENVMALSDQFKAIDFEISSDRTCIAKQFAGVHPMRRPSISVSTAEWRMDDSSES